MTKSNLMEKKVRKNRKVRTGIVVSNKMNKTGIMAVETSAKHPKYQKFIKKTSKFVYHDEKNETSIGDIVKIMETRPLSKTKKWRLVEIINKVQK
jgi:small subunit ribosomal protein S17